MHEKAHALWKAPIAPPKSSFSRFSAARKNPGNFAFIEHPKWAFFDGFVSHHPALVLYDSIGRPRHVLCFKRLSKGLEPQKGDIIIHAIQSEAPELGILETKESAAGELKRTLGMHPAEFLLSEFIHRNADYLRQGGELYLDSYSGSGGFRSRASGKTTNPSDIYRPLIDRFFEKRPIDLQLAGDYSLRVFKLSKQKERVKRLLEIH